MTLEQALQVLVSVTENIQLTRAQHIQVSQALSVIGEMIKSKKSVDSVVK